MAIVASWLRLELRRRWRALLVLALLLAISTGTVLTAVAGARRGDSSVDRLLAETLPAHAVALPSGVDLDWDAVRSLPQVEALSTLGVGRYTINGVAAASDNSSYLIPTDADLMTTVERPVVLAGRLADPTRADEAVITARYAEETGLGLGDAVQLGMYRPESIDPTGNLPLPATADGPVATVRVVGVIRSFFFADEPDSPGQVIPSAGLFDQYRANLLGVEQT